MLYFYISAYLLGGFASLVFDGLMERVGSDKSPVAFRTALFLLWPFMMVPFIAWIILKASVFWIGRLADKVAAKIPIGK